MKTLALTRSQAPTQLFVICGSFVLPKVVRGPGNEATLNVISLGQELNLHLTVNMISLISGLVPRLLPSFCRILYKKLGRSLGMLTRLLISEPRLIMHDYDSSCTNPQERHT